MGLSSKLFLLSADDTLHALASTAFMRMLRREDVARVPDFAGQRVRQASIVVEVVDGTPSRMVHWTFSILDIDADGLLDVERLSTQQFARVDDPFEPARPAQGKGVPSSMRPGALSPEAAPGSQTNACCAASRRRRWGKYRVRGFGWFDESDCQSDGGLVRLTGRDTSPRVHHRHLDLARREQRRPDLKLRGTATAAF